MRILRDIYTSWLDYPDNHSLAVVVVWAGCTHGCKGCHNKALQDFDNLIETVEISVADVFAQIIEKCRRNNTNKVVFSGGDPLAERNIIEVKELLEKLADAYSTCVYTGYDINYVKENLLNNFTYVKCGKFELTTARESYKTDDLFVLASPNQDFYNNKYTKLSINGVLQLREEANEH